jgi:poly-gamma-glutamate capsule biosynthesis protein CapA/YwtB (metallophosphatase superfamily)
MQTLDLIAVGDICPTCSGDHVPFEYVARYLRAGDIVFGNLECAICDTGIPAEKEITLHAPLSHAKYLRQAGFGVVSLANNHSLDFGSAGLIQTVSALREQGIRFVGAGDGTVVQGHQVVERRGLRVGFLAYGETDVHPADDGVFINRIDRETILDQLHSIRRECDTVVVSLHWGIEYVHYPSPTQVKLARDLVAEGATLVLGHHPHVIQGIEQIGVSLIAYSLGSFHIKPLRNGTARRSYMLHAWISDRGVERHRLIPVQLDDEDLPHLARGEDRREVMRTIQEVSTPIRENRITERWWFEQVAPIYLGGHLEAWIKRVRRYGLKHFMQFMRWLVSGFTIKCYLGYLRRRARLHE